MSASNNHPHRRLWDAAHAMEHRLMPGRKRLRGGVPRALGSHAGWRGLEFRRKYRALVSDLIITSDHLKQEAARVAARWVVWIADQRTLIDAQLRKETGKGRRSTIAEMRILQKREGISDLAYERALERLTMTAGRRDEGVPESGVDLLARQPSNSAKQPRAVVDMPQNQDSVPKTESE